MRGATEVMRVELVMTGDLCEGTFGHDLPRFFQFISNPKQVALLASCNKENTLRSKV
jgi:hypothetical protein